MIAHASVQKLPQLGCECALRLFFLFQNAVRYSVALRDLSFSLKLVFFTSRFHHPSLTARSPSSDNKIVVCIRADPPYVLPLDYTTIGPNGGVATLDFLRNVTLVGADIDGFDKRYLDYIFEVVGVTATYLPTLSESSASLSQPRPTNKPPAPAPPPGCSIIEAPAALLNQRLRVPDPFPILLQSLSDLYRWLLNGTCNMAVSSISLNPDRNTCNSSCPFFPNASLPDDWTSTTTSETSSESTSTETGEMSFVCCVEYSNPYYHSSYALLSIVRGHCD